MLLHYLKVAVRNLLKYKTQSVISILGLAVGFVCFALANLWTRYEMTYDTHLEGNNRMYVLYTQSVTAKYGYDVMSSYPMSTLLKESFPEVEAACAFNYWGKSEVKTEEGMKYEARMILADSCYMDMFHIRIAEGSDEFLYTNGKIAVTRDFAQRVFGNTDVLGKKITDLNGDTHTICAVLDGSTPHSNFSFDYWGEGAYFRRFYNDWSNAAYTTVVKLREGTDVNNFLNKMKEIKAVTDWGESQVFKRYDLYPLNQYHYADFNEEKSIQFNYLILFSTIGVLVILCSLFNYLSLFVMRIRIRLREIGLRKVYGATIGQMMGMFLIEYVPIILFSGLIGMMIIEWTFPAFQKISLVTSGMYAESLFYFAIVTLISVLILLPVLWYAPKLSAKGANNRFRKGSIFCQLVISIFFLFCVSVIMKQVHHLKNTDLGWERKNIAAFEYMYPTDQAEAIVTKIEQFSPVKEVLAGHTGLLPKNMMISIGIKEWEGKSEDTKDLNIEVMKEGKALFDFYHLQLVEGRLWDTEASNEKATDVVINESGIKAMGLHNPIGKQFTGLNKVTYHIIGVVKDFHTTPPTVPVKPLMFVGENIQDFSISNSGGSVILKYHPRQWKELKAKVDELFASEYPEVKYQFVNVEDVYAQYLETESLLMKLLGIVSVICMLISAFGVFSLVSLTCKQRQKEIAIRKINGATIRDILTIFVKEYTLMSLISAGIAFTAGYVIMKQWIVGYTLQTPINLWLFVCTYVLVLLIIAICIGYRVWKAANENPADVVKSE